MNSKILSFLLYATLSLFIQTSDASFSDEDSPPSDSSSSGKRRIIDVNNSDESDSGRSGKVPALMSPGTESFVNEATRMMGMGDGIIDIGRSDVEDEYDNQIDAFISQFSAEMNREESRILAVAVPEMLARRISERATTSPSAPIDQVTFASAPMRQTATEQLTIQTTFEPVTTVQTVTAQPTQVSPAASTLEREFWGFIMQQDMYRAKRILHRNPTFIPTLNDYDFRKMQTIMEHPNTQADLLKFLYGKFPHLFQRKYQNGQYISHVTHPNNIRTLLEIFPYDRNLRIVLLDDFLNSPLSQLVLDESFFNFIINNDNLLKHMFNTRPDLFLAVDYRQLPEGPFKLKLPVILSRLSNLFRTNDAIKTACFKISAIDPAIHFDFQIPEFPKTSKIPFLLR